MKKIIVVLLSLLMLMTVSGCSNGSSGISRGKMREIDPEEFTTLEYTAEVEGKGSALVTVDYEAMSEGLEKKLDSLYKEEYPDVYKTFKKMGFKPDLSNVLNIYADRKDELYNGDKITVHVTSGGDFSSYDIEDLLDALKIDMPTEYEMTVSGLREVEKIDITNGKNLYDFLTFEGTDGSGKVRVSEDFRLGSSVIKDKQGRTIYVNEKESYSGVSYEIVIDNKHVCTLTPMPFIESDRDVMLDNFYGNLCNGDRAGLGFTGGDALADYDLSLGSIDMREITQFGSKIEDGVKITASDVDMIKEAFNEEYKAISYMDEEPDYIFTDHDIYLVQLKPQEGMDNYGLQNNQALFVMATEQWGEPFGDVLCHGFLYNMFRYPDGTLSGTWGEIGSLYMFGRLESREEGLELLQETWDIIEKIN